MCVIGNMLVIPSNKRKIQAKVLPKNGKYKK